jgi:predicted nuclease of predicted toxin-antitoxin system
VRFLVDECAGPALAQWLKNQGHAVFSVYEEARGMMDDAIIHKAFIENWILVTADKDFGAMIYRDKRPHRGVVLLRLENERASTKIAAMQNLVRDYSDRLSNQYIVVTENRIRFGGIPPALAQS